MKHVSPSFFIRGVAGAVLVVWILPAAAQAGTEILAGARDAWQHGKTVIGVEVDNDSLLMRDLDGLYSSGARLAVARRLTQDGMLSTAGWRIGQELYTASDIKLPPERVGPPDRPYAGWLYAGVFHRRDWSDGRHAGLGIDIGCLGPCAGGKWTQNRLHSLLDDPRPQGWSRQIGHEAGVVLHGNAAPGRWSPAPWLDVTPAVHGRIGNIFTDAGTELRLRAGQLSKLPDQPTLHGFVRLDARAVLYNATLQGRLFANDVHTVSPRRWVGEAEAGVAWNRMPVEAGVSIVRRSNEIRDLPSSVGAQTFARLHLRYRFE